MTIFSRISKDYPYLSFRIDILFPRFRNESVVISQFDDCETKIISIDLYTGFNYQHTYFYKELKFGVLGFGFKIFHQFDF